MKIIRITLKKYGDSNPILLREEYQKVSLVFVSQKKKTWGETVKEEMCR
ncbi:hypothetical protein [Robinsoniella peoriensis]|nr:hypothetical protein [Robinsoniella peoriensis]